MSFKAKEAQNMDSRAATVIPPALSGKVMRLLRDGSRRDMTYLEVAVAKAQQIWTMKMAALPPDSRVAFTPPYTSGQIEIARAYRDLVEWREGSALRGSSMVMAGSRGQGGAGAFMDTFLQQGQQLDLLRSRVGNITVMDVRRHMDRDNARKTISALDLVDAVCLGDLDLTTVLKRFGWAPKGAHRATLRSGLCAALDRMQGIKPSTDAWHAEGVRIGFRTPEDNDT